MAPGEASDQGQIPAPEGLARRWERMWQAYLGGARSSRSLREAASVRTSEATQAIERGWPEYGWTAFRERLPSQAELKVDQRAAIVKQAEREVVEAVEPVLLSRAQAAARDAASFFEHMLAEWRSTSAEALAEVRATAAMLREMRERMGEAMGTADFTKTRKIKLTDAEGKERTEERPFTDGFAMVAAAAKLCQAQESLMRLTSIAAGGTPAVAKAQAAPPPDPEPTADELAALERGEIPPGWTPARVMRAAERLGAK